MLQKWLRDKLQGYIIDIAITSKDARTGSSTLFICQEGDRKDTS